VYEVFAPPGGSSKASPPAMLTTLLEISQNDIYAGDWLRHKNSPE
jgi:hypothetical protein